ncbi:MAG: response regulator, partial [Thermodesulfobacteriota bacterium]|nr:response regulator [Thermodesulfobacteriota bacterium]
MSKLLLIDDEKAIVRVLSISLKNDGYDVVAAYGGEEGLDMFRRESPDIVLTDIKMPGMDGIEVLKKIKDLDPDTEVIIITGHGDMHLAIEALHLGASDFINKPVKGEVLAITLKRAEERLLIRQKLREYTENLENTVKIATEEIRRKSEFQDKLITSSNDGIVATDEKGEVIIFNPGAEKIFGYSRLEVIKKMNVHDLYPPELAGEFQQRLKQGKIVKGTDWKEIMITARDGKSLPTRFSGALLYEKNMVVGSVGFFRDLREVKHLQQELIKAERLAAIGQTVTGLAHYIKNILSGLKGGSYVVNVGLDKNDIDKLKAGWAMVERNVGRVSELVLDLLTYSRERGPELRNCFPNEIADDVCELMEARASQNEIEIIKELAPSIGEVNMGADAVHRVLLNLVSNAVDACISDLSMDKEWQVYVKTALESDKMLRFEVIDNGCGMSEEIRKNLFTSFFSTKGGEGTGLGLLVTHKLVEEHGGTIDITSQLGKGSAFIIRLPYSK